MNSEEWSQLQIHMFNLKELNDLCHYGYSYFIFAVVVFFQIENPKPLPDGSPNYLYFNSEIKTLNTLS